MVTFRDENGVLELPETYKDVVIKHKNGHQRIGRLSWNKDYFDIATYQGKYSYVWSVADIVAWSCINFIEDEK